MSVEGRTIGSDGMAIRHLITFPLTCKFRIITNSLYSCGQAIFQIYNLTADVRSDLYKDPFEQGIYKQIVFAAGYQQSTSSGTAQGPSIPIIFQGSVLTAFSYRQGPDWITEITALDGGYSLDNAFIDLTKPSPYTLNDLLINAVAAMPKLSLGTIGDFSDIKNSSGITLSGNPWDLITRIVSPLNGMAFINKEKVFILRQWEFVQDAGLIDTISSETGMIGTPRFQDASVIAKFIFEPRLEIGQVVKLVTEEAVSRMSGLYKVLSLSHRGTISGAICEDLITEVNLYQPDRELVAA